MKKFLIPLTILIAGATSLFSPLYATGDCGVNPVIHVPSKCRPPHEVPANAPTGTCTLQDGSCWSANCYGTVWSNAVPGRCGNGIITENTVPRCLASYAVTNVLIYEYSTSCMQTGDSCTCLLMATGVSDNVPVCNCMDLEPLH